MTKNPLKTIARSHLLQLKNSFPHWNIDDLFIHLGIDQSNPILVKIATEVGFPHRIEPSPREIIMVLEVRMQGIFSKSVIARQLNIPRKIVDRVLKLREDEKINEKSTGEVKRIQRRSFFDESKPIERKISMVGQFSWRGNLYSLGKMYRGQIVIIREIGEKLEIRCSEYPPLLITKRLPRCYPKNQGDIGSDRPSMDQASIIRKNQSGHA